ncbi:flavodoxin family protein [Spongisporangium articulatum]|uniref:Flavodoxin family protein n=1 Tax=Spongisporangium articulatum TaxID=3362603 RepID=A0ABW8ALE1_9ACTN
MTDALTALVLVGTLRPTPSESSSELLGRQVLGDLRSHGVEGSVVRLVDHDIKPGVEVDMGDGDAWPALRRQLLAADILVLATPIWMGQLSSVSKRALERLDAELSETDEATGLPPTYGKVAVAAVVGNEDGAHSVSADVFQALNDVGFTIPAGGVTYWVGRAMEGVDYKDLDETPEAVASTTATLAANAVHVARFLKSSPYPPKESS